MVVLERYRSEILLLLLLLLLLLFVSVLTSPTYRMGAYSRLRHACTIFLHSEMQAASGI